MGKGLRNPNHEPIIIRSIITCSCCKIELPRSNFRFLGLITGQSKICKGCDNKKKRERYHRTKHTNVGDNHRRACKNSRLKHNYGMNIEQFDEYMAAQDNKCAICNTTFSTEKIRIFGPHVDHDHATGDPRGILCGTCNRGIGLLGDDAGLLRKAADYLDNPPIPKTILTSVIS